MEKPEKEAEPEKKMESINIEDSESNNDTEYEVNDSEADEEMTDFADGNGIIDRLKTNNIIDDIIKGSISICNLNYMTDLNLKEKSYLTKSNLW